MNLLHKHELKHDFDKGGNQYGLTIIYCWGKCKLSQQNYPNGSTSP